MACWVHPSPAGLFYALPFFRAANKPRLGEVYKEIVCFSACGGLSKRSRLPGRILCASPFQISEQEQVWGSITSGLTIFMACGVKTTHPAGHYYALTPGLWLSFSDKQAAEGQEQ
jgi:hypothetical protein